MIAILFSLSLLSGGCGQAVVQHVQQVQNPYVAAVTVPYADPFWTLVAQNQQEIIGQRKVDRLMDRIEELERQLRDCQQGKLSPPATGSSPLDEKVQAILTANCISCHSGTSAKGGVNLDQEGAFDVATRLSIANEVKFGRMPPKGADPLSDADFQLIDQWANQDAKAIRELLRQNRNIPAPAPPASDSSSTHRDDSLKPVSAKETSPRGVRRPLALELKEPPQ